MDIPSWKCFYLNRSVPARFWNVCHLHFNILYFVLFFIIKIRWPILNRVAQVVVLTMSLLFLKCTIMLKSSFICKGWRLNHLFLCNAIPVFGTANKSSFVICAICFFFVCLAYVNIVLLSLGEVCIFGHHLVSLLPFLFTF